MARVQHQLDAVQRRHDLGGQRRAVDRAVRESEEFESDADSNRRRSITHQGEPLTHGFDRPSTIDSCLSRWHDQQVLGAEHPRNGKARRELALRPFAIEAAVGTHLQLEPVEAPDFAGLDNRTGGRDLFGPV